jgi:serine phosphatase RsbU (regulator of sigma subunit)
VPDEAVLPSLEAVLVSERSSDELFATVATVTIDLSARTVGVRLAGHPPPLVLAGSAGSGGSAGSTDVRPCDARPGLVLGVLPGIDRPASHVTLSEEWALLMYTDGLIEGWSTVEGGDRLGVEGLCQVVADAVGSGSRPAELPGFLVGAVEERNGGPLADDVAVVLISPEPSS